MRAGKSQVYSNEAMRVSPELRRNDSLGREGIFQPAILILCERAHCGHVTLERKPT